MVVSRRTAKKKRTGSGITSTIMVTTVAAGLVWLCWLAWSLYLANQIANIVAEDTFRRNEIPHAKIWWDGVPAVVRKETVQPECPANIHPGDYTGPESCRSCHAENEAVRLIGADSLTRQGADWAIGDIFKVLDDPFVINRQFTSRWLRQRLRVPIDDSGYTSST